MHPAFSVIFLTTLIGVGQGVFLALFTGHLYSVIKVVPMSTDPQTFYGLGSLIALVFLGRRLAGFVLPSRSPRTRLACHCPLAHLVAVA